MTVQRFIVTEENVAWRVDRFVTEKLAEFTRSHVDSLFDFEAVLINDSVAKKKGQKLRLGDVVSLLAKPQREPLSAIAQPLPLAIIFEDEHVIVINKPAGMVVHPAPGHPDHTLVNGLLYHVSTLKQLIDTDEDEIRPGIVHRIDKDTSGLLVVAKSELALTSLRQQFLQHSIHRRYRAIVWGNRLADSGRFETRYGRHPSERKKMTSRPELTKDYSREAITHWRVLAISEGFSYVECQLYTGRTHQIRVHFSDAGHPLVADELYGRPLPQRSQSFPNDLKVLKGLSRHALHARELGFIHPLTGQELRFSEPEPPELRDIVVALFGEI